MHAIYIAYHGAAGVGDWVGSRIDYERPCGHVVKCLINMAGSD